MISRRFMLILFLVALPLLVGSECAFFFSSGGGSSDRDDPDDKSGLVVVISEGSLADPPVQGVNYKSGSVVGITGDQGEFRYEPGNTIQFFIGDIALGRAVNGKSTITLSDMVADGAADSPALTNMARLLQSLDAEPGDEMITIPPEVRAKAVRSNEGLSWAIEFLDFADEPAFVNAASHLVAVLTRDYAFTAVLVDADSAQQHMTKSIDK